MSDTRVLIFCLFMGFVLMPLYFIAKILEVILYPIRRYRRYRERLKWEQDYRNRLLFGNDYKEKCKW